MNDEDLRLSFEVYWTKTIQFDKYLSWVYKTSTLK